MTGKPHGWRCANCEACGNSQTEAEAYDDINRHVRGCSATKRVWFEVDVRSAAPDMFRLITEIATWGCQPDTFERAKAIIKKVGVVS